MSVFLGIYQKVYQETISDADKVLRVKCAFVIHN